MKDVQRELEKNKTKSGMIARDAVGSLNADIREAQCKKAGEDRYIWKTVHDDRVRRCHRMLDGKEFKWAEPPEMWYDTKHGRKYTGKKCNPGEDYCCRCIAIPIFDLKKIKNSY